MEQAVEQKYPHQGSTNPDVGMVVDRAEDRLREGHVRRLQLLGHEPQAQLRAGQPGRGGRAPGGLHVQGDHPDRRARPAASTSRPASRPRPRRPSRSPATPRGRCRATRWAAPRSSSASIDSANTCFANLIADPRVGPKKVTEYAAKMGINTLGKFKTVPSETLGTNNNTVLDMTGAYDTFANRGVFVPPTMITKVVRADGTVLYDHTHIQSKVLEPKQADEVTTAHAGRAHEGNRARRWAASSVVPPPARPEPPSRRPTPGSSASRPTSSPVCGSGTRSPARPSAARSAGSDRCPATAPTWPRRSGRTSWTRRWPTRRRTPSARSA